MGDKKLCPCIADFKYGVPCIGNKCMWWCEFADDCAVPTMAGILADSEISRTVFEASQQPKEEEDE